MRACKTAVSLGVLFIVATSLLAFPGCVRLPEYSVSVQADPGVTWRADVTVHRRVKGSTGWFGSAVIQDTRERSLPAWSLSLQHTDQDGREGRITKVAVDVLKISGEGIVRVTITRDGEVVAQDETSVIGAKAYCESPD